MELGVQLHELSLDTFKAFSSKIEASVYDAITVEAAILAKNVPGGTAPNQVQEQLKEIKRRLIWNKH
jgi:argininosuccinate lyase